MFRLLQVLIAALSLSTSFAISISRRQSVSTNAGAGWTYQGCYTDQVSSRVLAGTSYADSKGMTEEACIQFCGKAGYNIAGMEYAAECYCDYAIASSSTKQPDSDCSMACAGNPLEACGAGNRLTVFSTSTNQGPAVNPGPNGWNSLGCYSDVVSARTLRFSQNVAGGMSVAQCTAVCKQYGFQYSGLEYASECYCDNSLQNNAAPASTGCNMACSGNSSELCGGPNRLNLYQLSSSSVVVTKPGSIPAGWNFLGCFTDNVSARTLSQGQAVPGGYSNMTIEGCISACQNLGYTLAGLEYSQECYCDNTLKNSGSCASDQTTCNMLCKGNSAETCGGPNRLNMYQYGSSGAIATCPPNQAMTTSSTAMSSSSTAILATSSSSITAAGSSLLTPPASSSSPSTTMFQTIPSSTVLANTASDILGNSTIATSSAPTVMTSTSSAASISRNSTSAVGSPSVTVVSSGSPVNSANATSVLITTTVSSGIPVNSANATSSSIATVISSSIPVNSANATRSSSVTVVSSGIPVNSVNATSSLIGTVVSSGMPVNSANATTSASKSSLASTITQGSTVSAASTTISLATSSSSSTSPLTTITSASTTTTTTLSTSTSTKTTSTACVATDGTQLGYYVKNGDFETGSISPNSIGIQDSGITYTVINNGSSWTNCDSILINGGAYTGSTKVIEVIFPLNQNGYTTTDYANYNFRFSIGRLNSNPTLSNIPVAFYYTYASGCGFFCSNVGGGFYNTVNGGVCGSASNPCTTKRNGGSVWNQYTLSFGQNPSPTTFSLRFYFSDSYAVNEPVLLDNIAVF